MIPKPEKLRTPVSPRADLEVKTSTGLRLTQETFFFPAALLLSPEGSSYAHDRIVWIAASSPRGTIEESVARADMLMFGPCP
jgi:hypothetical protein